MSEEVLIPKMKRLDKRQKKIKIPLLNFVLILVCTLLIMASTFINIDLKHYILPNGFFSGEKVFTYEDFVYSFSIIPQVPVVLFVSSFLGKKMGTMSILLYIIAGLTFFPVFALGGGLLYVLQYSFGYILGYIPAAILCATFLKKSKKSYLHIFIGVLLGVFVIHFLGIIYMSLVALIKHDGLSFIKGWIGAQSGLKILYDFIISFVFVLIGRYFHSFLKYIQD